MEEDRYDHDLEHGLNHCKHGVYVGNANGPDYMCQYCEGDWSDEEYRLYCRDERARLRNRLRLEANERRLNAQFKDCIKDRKPGSEMTRRQLGMCHRWLNAKVRAEKARGE